MSCLLVTGGAGFIGSNFVRMALRRTDARVVVLDKLTYAGSLRSLEDVSGDSRFHFIKGDICDRQAVGEIFRQRRPTALVNFAAESHVDRSIDGPRAFVETNIVGVFELLEATREYLRAAPRSDSSSFRFVQISTDEVYGSLGETGLFSETTPYAPNSPYAASKASADYLVRAYSETFGVPTIITNCSNNYGPYQFPEKLIPLMILSAVRGKALPIYGDGSNVRDWIHVEDHCAGILRVLEGGNPGEKYNIGGRNERSNLQVVDAICEALEELRPAAENEALAAGGVRSYSELKRFVEDRPGHDQRYAIDAAKIRRQLAWEPRHTFESGLRETVRWYLENAAWCEAVSAGRYGGERLGLSEAQGDS